MQAFTNHNTKIIFLAAALAATSGNFKILQANPLAVADQQKSEPASMMSVELARQAVSENPIEAETAIQALRKIGPAGIEMLASGNRSTLVGATENPQQKQSAQWKRLANAFEKVGAQHDNWASQLYWFTDLEAAKAAAKKENKPILSLRLLGNLDEELSCANSRFFRTALYPNANIRKILRENYILHWQSVRPVPKVTIDFGDGRKIQTTITGNSIHYVLDSQGRVLDALPGLYGPGAFFKWLERMQKVNEESVILQGVVHETFLKKFHQERFAQINRDWQKDASKFPPPFFLRLREAAPVNMLQSMRDTTQFSAIQQTSNAKQSPALANQSTPAPTAREAGVLPLSKMGGEIGLLKAVTIPIPRDRAALSRKVDDDLWQNVAGLHMADAKLDANSLEVLRTKTLRPQTVAATFEKSVAEDSVRNEYSRHTTIHSWLAKNPNVDLNELNARVYSEIFLTPDSDQWLGLLPADAYTGIQNDGVVGARLQNIAATDPKKTEIKLSSALKERGASSGKWKAGDKVEAWNVAWYKATILEVGSGEHAGQFKVHYDDFSSASDQWVSDKTLRSANASAKAEKANQIGAAGKPRLGRYLIYSYGAGKYPLFLGHFELMSGGRYRASRSSKGSYYGSGKYSYTAKTKSIKWLTGPYVKDKWSGNFSVTREGKTHNIRLYSSTNASNSSDSK